MNPCAEDRGRLHRDEVDVWRIELDQNSEIVLACQALLSAEECARADRLITRPARQRWIVARGALRIILGTYTGVQPQALPIKLTRSGKPRLSHAGREIFFSLSHSGHLALVAISAAVQLGVDIEIIRPEFEFIELVEMFFAPDEVREIQSLAPSVRLQAFYACWVRKEAYLKAVGAGPEMPLHSFALSASNCEPPRLLWSTNDPHPGTTWHVQDLEEPGAAAALATIRPPSTIRRCAFGFASETDPLKAGA